MTLDRDEQCPSRGPALSHVQNGYGTCKYCGSPVEKRLLMSNKGEAQRTVCKGYGCISYASTTNPYCVKCEAIRHQSTVSHEVEGHSNFIAMCILCERLQSIGAR